VQRQIAPRPDVGSKEDHQKVDIGGPPADARDLHELGANGIVTKRLQVLEVESPFENRARQLPAVSPLLRAESDRLEAGVVEFQEFFGFEG
jgi:hypothetical protein